MFSGSSAAAPLWPTRSGRPLGQQPHVRRTTTIAQSSRRSPPTQRRHSSSATAASCSARQLVVLGEHAVEPLLAVQLTGPARLDDAVGVEDDRGAGRERPPQLARTRCPGVDSEDEPLRVEAGDARRRVEQARRRVTGGCAGDLATAEVDRQVQHRDELARRRSPRRRRRSRRRGTLPAPGRAARASGRRTSPSPCRLRRRSRGR